jgi:hypothetical protein
MFPSNQKAHESSMDSKALELAKAKFCRAEIAVEALKVATDFESAEYAWSDFILASGNIFAKLEQGAKKNTKARAWFNDKKDERRSDHLLLYLHEARNSDEHGIVRVTERYEDAGRPPLGMTKPGFGKRIPLRLYNVDQKTMRPIGVPVEAFYPGSFIKLVGVRYDRTKFCEPPRTHLGVEVKAYAWPQEVADLCLAYLRSLLVEAEGFV